MRNLVRRVVTALGVLALGAAFAAFVAPDRAVPADVRALLATVSPTVLIGIVTWFGVMVWLDRARRRSHSPVPPLEDEWPDPPTRADPDTAAPVGASWSTTLATATSTTAPREDRIRARDEVESELRTTAVELYGLVHGVDTDDARTAVESGAWTADARASALLGGPESPSPPWYVRLFDLLLPESSYLRQVRHTTAALRDLAGGDGGDRR